MSDYVYPVNLGNPSEITIKQFAKEIIQLTGKKNKIIFKDLPVDDPMRRKPDIKLANQILNWKPIINRKTGLEITIKWFKNLSDNKINNNKHRNFNDYEKKKKVLITGVAGFIGMNVALKFLEENYDVIGIDNFLVIITMLNLKK